MKKDVKSGGVRRVIVIRVVVGCVVVVVVIIVTVDISLGRRRSVHHATMLEVVQPLWPRPTLAASCLS